ncbi:MAG: hypothetical protein NUV86_10365 [Candidatus Scalindua sp.]|nr:hypothetical protein [Candidatus Scalindua sp.]MCR4345187.1 hypothetical protein [Candidatus Scalindua sp.]
MNIITDIDIFTKFSSFVMKPVCADSEVLLYVWKIIDKKITKSRIKSL